MSSGVLGERAVLIVADFENRTTDSTLGQSITEALRIDLARSPVVRLMDMGDVAAALQRMQRDGGTALTAEVAREVAEREGATAVVDRRDRSARRRLRALGPGARRGRPAPPSWPSGRPPSDAAGLIAAVDQLSRKLREGIGESLRSIRGGERLEAGDHLIARCAPEVLRRRSGWPMQAKYEEARDLLEETLKLDSTFAMAWRKLGVVLGNNTLDNARKIEAVRRAYQLRDRLPERERLITTAYYYNDVEIDVDRQIQAYEQVLARWPDDATSLNNLALAYAWKGRFADAARVARHGVETSPSTSVLWTNLIEAQILGGDLAAAESSLAGMAQAAPDARDRYVTGYRLAWARGDYPTAAAYVDSVGQSPQPGFQTAARFQGAALSMLAGRLAEAERSITEGIGMNLRRGAVAAVYNTGVPRLDSWLRGQPQRAVRYMDSVLQEHPLDSIAVLSRPYLQLATFYAQAGNTDRAEQLIREYERLVPEGSPDGG